jgi:catalase
VDKIKTFENQGVMHVTVGKNKNILLKIKHIIQKLSCFEQKKIKTRILNHFGTIVFPAWFYVP